MKAIYQALANFQQEVPVIHKGTQGYGYSYTDLPAIFEVINPLLKKNKLGFTQLVNENKIDTILFHIESGEEIKSSTPIPENVELAKMNQFQVLGSAITYIRRYALSSMLGLVTDKDTDAGGQQVKSKQTKKELSQKEIDIIKGKIIAASTKAKLTEMWNKTPVIKTNSELTKLIKETAQNLD